MARFRLATGAVSVQWQVQADIILIFRLVIGDISEHSFEFIGGS